jgi:hypothetical protein
MHQHKAMQDTMLPVLLAAATTVSEMLFAQRS